MVSVAPLYLTERFNRVINFYFFTDCSIRVDR